VSGIVSRLYLRMRSHTGWMQRSSTRSGVPRTQSTIGVVCFRSGPVLIAPELVTSEEYGRIPAWGVASSWIR